MTRLTKDIRTIICNRALSHAFDKRTDELRKIELGIGDRIYDCCVDDQTQKQLTKVPREFLNCALQGYVRIAAQDHRVTFGTTRPVRCNAFLGVIEATHPLSEEWVSLRSGLKTLEDEKRATKNRIMAVLDSVTTVKRLREVWPECEPFLKGIDAVPNTLPAVQVGDLNKMLGLPVDKPTGSGSVDP